MTVHEQAPHLLIGHRAHEVFDVDAAIAQRAARFVGLGDLGGEGDDTFKARLDLCCRLNRAHGTLFLSLMLDGVAALWAELHRRRNAHASRLHTRSSRPPLARASQSQEELCPTAI